LRGEGGGLREGVSVYYQPGTGVDEHSHHEIKRGISKEVKGLIQYVGKGRCKKKRKGDWQ
jgi:hypothetical protein